jgi:hypothetical protein
MKATQRVLLATILLAAPHEAWPHHSNVAVDISRRATVEGTVRTLEWKSPHVWLWIVSDDGGGKTLTFAFESSSPSELARFFGWNKRTLQPGDRVTVEYAPFRNGDNGGQLANLTFADGRRLPTPLSNRAPAPAR